MKLRAIVASWFKIDFSERAQLLKIVQYPLPVLVFLIVLVVQLYQYNFSFQFKMGIDQSQSGIDAPALQAFASYFPHFYDTCLYSETLNPETERRPLLWLQFQDFSYHA